MDKIIQWIKQNKQITIIGIGLVFLTFLFISALIPKKDLSGVALIEQPLYFYKNKTITIPQDVYKAFKAPKKKYGIYKIKSENQNIKVEGIISQLNINVPTKNTYSNILYIWNNKKGDQVQYDVKTQTLSVTLNNSINVFPQLSAPTDTQLQASFNDFTHKYISQQYQYSDIQIRRQPSGITISSKRMFDGIPLEVPGMEANYDFIQLDTQYRLKAMKFLLVNFEEKPSDILTTITSKQLASVVSKDDYPKEINHSGVSNLDGTIPTNNIQVMADALENGNVPTPDTYNVNKIEIVYFFSNTTIQFITPVYRLTASGPVKYMNQDYNIDSIINASAVDPNHVYIPSNIIYAD